MSPAPDNIDPDAIRILREAGFVWDSRISGFRRNERDDAMAAVRDGAVIDYEFLREQKLIADSPLDPQGRRGQLLRLRILLQSLG